MALLLQYSLLLSSSTWWRDFRKLSSNICTFIFETFEHFSVSVKLCFFKQNIRFEKYSLIEKKSFSSKLFFSKRIFFYHNPSHLSTVGGFWRLGNGWLGEYRQFVGVPALLSMTGEFSQRIWGECREGLFSVYCLAAVSRYDAKPP